MVQEWKLNNWFMKTIFVINGIMAVIFIFNLILGIASDLL